MNPEPKTQLLIEEIQKKLKTFESSKDVFKCLSTAFMKEHKIDKEQYDELWNYWKANKPKVVKRDMTSEEQETFGDMVEPGTQIEETVPLGEDGRPDVEKIPF